MFSVVHIHLAINHSPLYAETFAFFLLLIGTMHRNRTLATSGLVVTVIAGLCAVASFMTGDGAASFLKSAKPPLAGVDLQAIGLHNQAAGFLLVAGSITGVLALFALWWGRRRERPRWMEIATLVLIAWTLTVAARVSFLGGRIHHQEVRGTVQG